MTNSITPTEYIAKLREALDECLKQANEASCLGSQEHKEYFDAVINAADTALDLPVPDMSVDIEKAASALDSRLGYTGREERIRQVNVVLEAWGLKGK